MSTITQTTEVSTAGTSWIQRHPLVAYFLIAFAGTWTAIIPVVLSTGFQLFTMPDAVSFLLFMVSPYLGPLLGAVVVTRALEGGAGVRRLLRRIFQWRVGVQWYLAALFLILLIWLAGYSILLRGEPLRQLLANPLLLATSFLPNVAAGMIIPSLGEEVGWRGFALPRLQGQYSPVAATLILGTLHGLWHFPAFFTPFLGPFTPVRFLTFLLTAIAATFVYTWVVNNARGSILIAILLHAASNAASTLVGRLIPEDIAVSPAVEVFLTGWFNVLLFGLLAFVLVAATRGRLGFHQES